MSPTATARRSLPLPVNPFGRRLRPATHLYRAAAAHLRSYVSRSTPLRAAEQMFGRDIVTAEILKAASTPAETTTAGWALEIVRVAIFDMIQSITSLSAAAEVITRGLKLNMDGLGTLRVPGRVVNPTAAGAWIAEGNPAPARALSFSNAAILQPRRLSVLYTYSREQAESSNIENIVRQTLGEACGLALDAQMFSATAGDASKPAGLLAGVAPLTPASGGGVAARDGDLKNLFAALAAQGAGKTAILVCAMPQAVTLKASVGPKFDFDIVASTVLPPGTVVALEVASFVSGFSATPQFRVSNLATYHAEDTSPGQIVSPGGTLAVPVKSMFQTDSIGLYMNVWAAWGLRAAGHAQWIQGATW
jgi:hypothetical protein